MHDVQTTKVQQEDFLRQISRLAAARNEDSQNAAMAEQKRRFIFIAFVRLGGPGRWWFAGYDQHRPHSRLAGKSPDEHMGKSTLHVDRRFRRLCLVAFR